MGDLVDHRWLIRKAKVTPSGTLASTKPMKSGTAEQLQKGVTIPKPGSCDSARQDAASGESTAHASRVEIAARESHGGHDSEQEQQHLRNIKEEKVIASLTWLPRSRRSAPKLSQSAEWRLREPGDEPGCHRGGDDDAERDVGAGQRRTGAWSPGGVQEVAQLRERGAAGSLVAFVVDPARVSVVPRRPHQAGVTELRQMVAHIVLALVECRRHLADAVGAVAQQAQDPGAGPDRPDRPAIATGAATSGAGSSRPGSGQEGQLNRWNGLDQHLSVNCLSRG